MTTAAIHIPARHYRPEPARDYAALFERWLGYRLHPAIRHVFTHLERQRAKRLPQRLFIRANPEVDTLLRTALADYLRWRLDVTDPLETCVVYARDRKGLTQFSHPKSLLYTSYNPEGPRGLTFRMVLVLDADTYPDRGRHFDRVWRTVASPLDFTHHSLLIVHGTPRPRMRVNSFTLRYKALLRDHSLPLIDLTLPPSPITDRNTNDCGRGAIHRARPAAGTTRPGGQEPPSHQSEPTPCNRKRHCGRDLSRPYSPSNTPSDCRDAIHRVRLNNPKQLRSSKPPHSLNNPNQPRPSKPPLQPLRIFPT